MKTLFATLIAAVSLIPPAVAGARIEPLRPQRGAPAVVCTADRVWCVEAAGSSATVRTAGVVAAALPLEHNEEQRVESTVWPSLVRVKLAGQREFVLAGVARTERQAYSGGGGSVTTLTLFEVRPGIVDQPRPVLDVPLESSFMIRACFAREDEQRRRGACHDEYRYRASLTAAPGNRLRLVYKARAESFPGRRSRLDDSTVEKPLRKGELYWAADRRCTFTRALVGTRTGAFDWSVPPPDCASYVDLQ